MLDTAIELLNERKEELLSERSWTEMRLESLKHDLEVSGQLLAQQNEQITKLEKAIAQLGGNIE